jgi:hypothetical protein
VPASTAFLTCWAVLAAGQPNALLELRRACPALEGVQEEWASVVRASTDAIVLRRGSGLDEAYRRVQLPSCRVLGYSWALDYVGGYSLAPALQPQLIRDGNAVEWTALTPEEQRELSRAMGARLGSRDERSLAGMFLRREDAVAKAQPVFPQKVVTFAGVPPRAEGRVLIDGVLFFGARVKKLASFLGRDIYGVSLGPTGHIVARTFPSERLWVHDPAANRSVLLFEMSSGTWDLIAPVAPHGLRVTFPTKRWSRDHILFDFKNGLLHPLTAETTPESPGFIAVEEDGSRRVVWFKEGHGIAIDYPKLLSSAGVAGIEEIAPEAALAWGEAHHSLSALLTVYLLSPTTKDAALAALTRFRGWKPASGERVGVRASARGKARIVVQTEFLPSFEPEWDPLIHLGTLGDEAFLVWPAPDDAIIAVPKKALQKAPPP